MRVVSLALAASLSFSTMTAFADWKQEGNTGSIRIVMANMRLRHGSGSMAKVTALIPMEICMPIHNSGRVYGKRGWRMDCKRCCTDKN